MLNVEPNAPHSHISKILLSPEGKVKTYPIYLLNSKILMHQHSPVLNQNNKSSFCRRSIALIVPSTVIRFYDVYLRGSSCLMPFCLFSSCSSIPLITISKDERQKTDCQCWWILCLEGNEWVYIWLGVLCKGFSLLNDPSNVSGLDNSKHSWKGWWGICLWLFKKKNYPDNFTTAL